MTWCYLYVTGEDSGRIVIWNMAPVVSEKTQNDENVPKMLCQMDNHLGR
jgi:protein HIRA/HIR1